MCFIVLSFLILDYFTCFVFNSIPVFLFFLLGFKWFFQVISLSFRISSWVSWHRTFLYFCFRKCLFSSLYNFVFNMIQILPTDQNINLNPNVCMFLCQPAFSSESVSHIGLLFQNSRLYNSSINYVNFFHRSSLSNWLQYQPVKRFLDH